MDFRIIYLVLELSVNDVISLPLPFVSNSLQDYTLTRKVKRMNEKRCYRAVVSFWQKNAHKYWLTA